MRKFHLPSKHETGSRSRLPSEPDLFGEDSPQAGTGGREGVEKSEGDPAQSRTGVAIEWFARKQAEYRQAGKEGPTGVNGKPL